MYGEADTGGQYDDVSSKVEEIGPERASQMLAMNRENRRIDRGTVDRYAAAMRRGEWQFSHQGIAVDKDGVLLDGQHRLAAIVKAGIPVPMLVVDGVDRAAFSVVDTGKRRSAGDTLRLSGVTDSNNVAAALRYVHLFRTMPNGQWHGSGTRLTNDQVLELFQSTTKIVDCVRDARQIATATGIIPSAAAAAIYVTTEAAPAADWLAWSEGIMTGANLALGDPRLAFRNFFSNARSGSKRRVDAQEHMAIYIRAWNYWIEGKSRKNLQYRTGDPMPMPVYLPCSS